MTTELATRIIKLLEEAKEMIRQGKPGANAWINGAIDEILLALYFAEFETIDGETQHREGYTYEQWVKANNYETYLSL